MPSLSWSHESTLAVVGRLVWVCPLPNAASLPALRFDAASACSRSSIRASSCLRSALPRSDADGSSVVWQPTLTTIGFCIVVFMAMLVALIRRASRSSASVIMASIREQKRRLARRSNFVDKYSQNTALRSLSSRPSRTHGVRGRDKTALRGSLPTHRGLERTTFQKHKRG